MYCRKIQRVQYIYLTLTSNHSKIKCSCLNINMKYHFSFQKVHIRNKPCSRGSIVACVCAIAVKEGNDTLIMDMCETSPVKKLHRTASSDGKLAKGAKITSSGGNAYTVSYWVNFYYFYSNPLPVSPSYSVNSLRS